MIRFVLISILSFLGIALMGQTDTAHIYTFGGPEDEQGIDIEFATDGGYITVGTTSSFGNGNSDIYLVKVDSNFKHEWSSAIGSFHLEFGNAVKQTSDGGYIICGYSNSGGNGTYDGYLVKTNDSGVVIWDKFYGGLDWDKFYDLEITPDGGFMMVGETHSNGAGNADAWVVKTDINGTVQWEKFYGGKNKDVARAMISTRDGNYAFCGENASKNDTSKADGWLVKISDTGKVIFDVTKVGSGFDVYNDLVEANDSGFTMIGSSNSFFHDEFDIYLSKFSPSGGFLWDEIYGVIKPKFPDYGNGIQAYSNGNYLIVGTSIIGNTGFNFYTAMTGPKGEYITAPSYGGNEDDFGNDALINPKGGEIFYGTFNSNSTAYTDQGIIQVDTVDGNKFHVFNSFTDNKPGPLTINDFVKTGNVNVYPNPFVSEINVRLSNVQVTDIEIHSVDGKLIHKMSSKDEDFISVQLQNIPAGLYYMHLVSEDHVEIIPIIKGQ